eukprot:3525692-Prymnesium_polylepis.1
MPAVLEHFGDPLWSELSSMDGEDETGDMPGQTAPAANEQSVDGASQAGPAVLAGVPHQTQQQHDQEEQQSCNRWYVERSQHLEHDGRPRRRWKGNATEACP